MSVKIYQYAPWKKILKTLNLSEYQVSEKASMSRLTFRSLAQGKTTASLNTFGSAANAFDREVSLILAPREMNSDLSTIAVSLQVIQDGASSWKIHFMNLVDEFRRSLDPRILLLPPSEKLPIHLKALLASIVISLCEEVGIQAPPWATKPLFLKEPWFVSEMESLKAMALIESPLAFRRNNIFVLNNFLERF